MAPADDFLDDLVCHYLEFAEGGRAIGFVPDLRVELFVDLLSAALVADQGRAIARALIETLLAIDPEVDGVVAPKWGNPILGSHVADELGLPLLLGRDDNLFGRWFDGRLERDRRWFLVDDVASDGERLVELLDRAKDEGLEIESAHFVVVRSEGDAVQLLAEEGVPLTALRTWDDEGLRQLRARWQGEADVGG